MSTSIWLQKSASIQPRTSSFKYYDFAEKSERFSQCSLKKNRPCEMVDLTQEKSWVRSTMSNLTGSRPRCGDMAGSTPCLRTKSRHTLVLALSKVRIWSICTFGAEARCGSGHVAKNAHFWSAKNKKAAIHTLPLHQKYKMLEILTLLSAKARVWLLLVQRQGVVPAMSPKVRAFDRPKT